MKKFVAMMMVVLMICGVALAEEPRDVVDYINMSCLWYDMVDCGNSELVTALLGTELEWPTETLIGYVFDDDNGYFLEYIDEEGTHYSWLGNDPTFFGSCATVLTIMKILYSDASLENCLFAFGNELYVLSKYGFVDDEYYTDEEEFNNDMIYRTRDYYLFQ